MIRFIIDLRIRLSFIILFGISTVMDL